MDRHKNLESNGQDLFVRYREDMTKACERAVREALLKHKQAGNSIAVARDGKVVLIPADAIVID